MYTYLTSSACTALHNGLADTCTELTEATALSVLIPEQAVQQTVDTGLGERRHQCQSTSKRYHKYY